MQEGAYDCEVAGGTDSCVAEPVELAETEPLEDEPPAWMVNSSDWTRRLSRCWESATTFTR